MNALDQYEVEEIKNNFLKQSQAIKEQIFDVVLNSEGCVSLSDVYNLDSKDFMMLKNKVRERIEIKNKNYMQFFNV